MSVDRFESGSAVATDDGLDDLQKFLRRVEAEKPEVRERREDLRELHHILDELVALRKACGMSQTDVAKVMGVKQPTISQFETESSDPKISTLQRYARAVGTRLRVSVAPAPAWTARGCFPYEGRPIHFALNANAGVLAFVDPTMRYAGGTTTTRVSQPEQSPLPAIAKALANATIGSTANRAVAV